MSLATKLFLDATNAWRRRMKAMEGMERIATTQALSLMQKENVLGGT